MGHVGFLLDTHCWLWWQLDYARIPSPVRRRIGRRESRLYLSAASVLEIAVKHAQGKLPLPTTPSVFLSGIIEEGGVALPISGEHALQAARLPNHHRDPFDRLLIAQAQLEGLHLVTADPRILAYNVASIDARK